MSRKPLNIILLGPPGAGKDTQAQKLIKKFDLFCIATGDFARKLEDQGDQKVKELVAGGNFISDELVEGYVFGEINKMPLERGILLDGFPRNLTQGKDFEKFLEPHPRNFLKVFIKISDDIIIQRLLGRGRRDDKEEIIKTRIKNFKTLTEPVVSYYREKGDLIEVNGEAGPEEVWVAIKNALEKA